MQKPIVCHGLKNTVHGHVAVVEVAEDFDFVIDLGHGDCIQDTLVNVGAGTGQTFGVLIRVNQVERGKIVCTALLTGTGLSFTDTHDFGSGSHVCFLLDLNMRFVIYWFWTIHNISAFTLTGDYVRIISPVRVIVKSPFRVNRMFVDFTQRGINMIPIYAQRIREVRQKAGLTQTEFANSIGTTKTQLSKYELNTQDTPTKIVIAVCEKYNVDANWLLGLMD